MRLLALSAAMSALLTVVTAAALRASDPVLAVLAASAVTVLLTWYARLHADDDHPALGLVNPASATTLAAVGRRSWSTLLPTWTAHVVGAVLGGVAALGLGDRWGDPLLFDADDLVIAGVGAAVVGLVGAWATLALDASGPDALAAVPVVVAGGVLPLGTPRRLLAVGRPGTRSSRSAGVGRRARGCRLRPARGRRRRVDRRIAASCQ